MHNESVQGEPCSLPSCLPSRLFCLRQWKLFLVVSVITELFLLTFSMPGLLPLGLTSQNSSQACLLLSPARAAVACPVPVEGLTAPGPASLCTSSSFSASCQRILSRRVDCYSTNWTLSHLHLHPAVVYCIFLSCSPWNITPSEPTRLSENRSHHSVPHLLSPLTDNVPPTCALE